MDRLTSKRYTASSIRRILVYILIGLTGKTADSLTGISREGKISEPALFARVLQRAKVAGNF